MAHQLQLEKTKYRQWAKASLGLGYLKDGLAPFCQEIATLQHRDLLHTIQREKSLSLPVICGACNLPTLLPDHKRIGNKVCPFGQINCNCWFPNGKIACPNKICGAIYDQIIMNHASTPPMVSWKNTDSQQWTSDPWSIAKCFINAPGYKQKTCAYDTDCTGLFLLIKNNLYYHNHISCTLTGQSVFSKVLMYRNEILHSSSMELEESECNKYIDDMISILQDGKELVNNPDAQEAVKKLQVLKSTEFIITSYSTEEILDQIKEEMEKSLSFTREKNVTDEGKIEAEKVHAEIKKKLIELETLIDKESEGKIEAEKEHAEIKKKLTELEILKSKEKEEKLESENEHTDLKEKLTELDKMMANKKEAKLQAEREHMELKKKLTEHETLMFKQKEALEAGNEYVELKKKLIEPKIVISGEIIGKEKITHHEAEKEVEKKIIKLEAQLSEEKHRKHEVVQENAALKQDLEELEKLIKNFRVTRKQLCIAYLEEQKRTEESTGKQPDDENAISDLSEVKEKRVDTNDANAQEGELETGKDTDTKGEGTTDSEIDIKVLGKTGDITKPSIDHATTETIQTPDTTPTKSTWNDCISYAKQLVERKTLPSQSEVNEACRVFGRHSKILSDMCSLIAEHIKKKSPDVTSVWPAYVTEDNIISVVFVVMKKESNVPEIEGYDYKVLFKDQYSDEGKLVASEKVKDESIYRQYADELKQMRACINKNADACFNRHSNLNVMLPSLIKSTGYKSGKHVFKVMPCIALYVTSKGYIPLKEEPFEKKIGAFPIDILEGGFTPFMANSDEDLKMGLAVHGKDSLLGTGTLGGFVDHPKHGLCGLTCAHVVYSKKELTAIKKDKKSRIVKQVYQGIGEGSSAFGEAVIAVFDEGTETVPGVDVSLIQIQKRHPKDGSFPNAAVEGFSEKDQLRFNSGRVCEAADLDILTSVYKIGIRSGFTRGSVGLQGVALRKKHADVLLSNDFRFYLKDQITICSLQTEPKFASKGDSGSLVLKKDNEDSVAIGLLEGGLNTGEVLVTPICDILRAVGCKEMKMCNFNEKVSPCWNNIIKKYSQRAKLIITFAAVMLLFICTIMIS